MDTAVVFIFCVKLDNRGPRVWRAGGLFSGCKSGRAAEGTQDTKKRFPAAVLSDSQAGRDSGVSR